MQVYLVYTNRWMGSYPDFYVDGVFEHEEDAWKYLENKYNTFLNRATPFMDISIIRIDSNKIVIHYEDTTGRNSIIYNIETRKLR